MKSMKKENYNGILKSNRNFMDLSLKHIQPQSYHLTEYYKSKISLYNFIRNTYLSKYNETFNFKYPGFYIYITIKKIKILNSIYLPLTYYPTALSKSGLPFFGYLLKQKNLKTKKFFKRKLIRKQILLLKRLSKYIFKLKLALKYYKVKDTRYLNFLTGKFINFMIKPKTTFSMFMENPNKFKAKEITEDSIKLLNNLKNEEDTELLLVNLFDNRNIWTKAPKLTRAKLLKAFFSKLKQLSPNPSKPEFNLLRHFRSFMVTNDKRANLKRKK